MIRRLGFVLAIIALVSGAGLLLRAEPPQEVGTWASIGTAPENRIGAAAVALPDGRTLIVGGLANGTPTDAVVVFEPADSSFATAGQLLEPRAGHTATLLEDGRVLIAGGKVNDILTGDLEIFDPSDGSSTLVATLAMLRSGHAAARIGDGKVLIAGGTGTDGVLQTAEIFDSETGSVSLTGSALNIARTGASATALIDGRVLIAGGNNGSQDLASAEIYNPSTDSFQATDTNLDAPRSNHTAVLLPYNNSVLIAGGTSNGVPLATADLFLPAQFPDPFTYGMGQFALTGEMAAPRSGAAGGPHVEGYAFVVGGGQSDAEVYRFPTIKTDKDDYAPGQTAIITGSGWEANEEVRLLFQEDPAVHDDYVLTVTAGGEGNIYHDQWAPEEHDANVRFYLMAIGQQSGHRAQMTFTDSVGLTINNPALVWHRTGEVPGGFDVSGVAGTYTCTPGSGGNNCTSVTNLTITVSGSTGSKVLTGLANNANGVAWGPVTLEFRTAPGLNQFTIPAADGRYAVTATLNSSPNSPNPATRNNYFGVDNTAPTTSILCNNVACANPYNANVQVKLSANDGPASNGSGVASTIYCVDTADVCVPGTTYPGGPGFTVPFVAGTTSYVRYRSTDTVGNGETTKSQPIVFAAANTAPVAIDDSATVHEDSVNDVIDVLANDTDADNVSPALPNAGLTVVAVGSASNGSASLLAGMVTYTPNANYCGPDSFTYTVSDNGTSSAGHIDQGAVSIDVTCINDVPSFTAGGNVTVLEDSGAYSAAWATGISAGPSNESGQTLNFIVSNNNPSLFSVQPAVTPSGVLSFTPAPNAAGNATVDVQIHDNGGTANNGVDTSVKQTFTITVTGVNDEPSFTGGGNVTVLEDSGAYSAAWATAIDDGDQEANQTLTFHLSNDNNALFSAQPAISSMGTLTFTPAANANGSAVVSVYLTDDGGTNTGDDTSPTQTFTIFVTAVNDAPSFTKGGDVTVAEDSGGYSAAGWATGISAGPADESLQALDFIVSNDNPSLFLVQPAVAANGTLTFTPAADENGTATVTVRLHDDGGTANFGVDTSAPQTFTIDVTAVNDDPDAVDDSGSVPEDDATGVLVDVLANDTKGPANESGQTLTITLVGTPTHGTAVEEGGKIRYKPTDANYFGPDSFTYTIRDNGQTNGVDDFKTDMATVNITVTPVNDAPANLSLNLSSGSINENTSTTLSGSFTDVEATDSHTVEINWGDSSATTTLSLGAGVLTIPSTSHTYLDDNPTGTTSDSYTISVTVTDNGKSGSPLVNDFKFTTGSTSVTVNNVAPTKTANPFTFDPYTGVASAGVSFSDQGWLDLVSATWTGITGTTGPIGPGLAGPALTGTFTATQTFTGCVASAISVRVSDDDTGYFDHTFAAANSLGTYTAAFLAPIKDGVRNVVKHGNVVPVKVEIRDCHGNLVTNRTLSIVLYAGMSSPTEVAEGDLVIASSVSSADSGNTMRLADGHYMYNLATKPLTLGFPYTIWIKDGTMTVATAVITTKK